MSSYKTALAVAAITFATPGVHAWYKNLPKCVDSYTPFTHLGCYDNAQPGALLERMDMDANNMTIEACTATCKGKLRAPSCYSSSFFSIRLRCCSRQ